MSVFKRIINVFCPRNPYTESFMALDFYTLMTAKGRSARLVIDCNTGALVCLTSKDPATLDHGLSSPPSPKRWQLQIAAEIATHQPTKEAEKP